MVPDFDEDKHPRDKDGKFAATEGVKEWVENKLGDGIRRASPAEFHKAFEKAFEGSPFTNHVTHYTPDELKGMKMFVADGGKAGIAVHDHGDGRVEGTALFNQGAAKGVGRALLAHAIQHAGVNYLECYGEGLRALYESAGFKVETTSPFNPEYAAKGWDYAKFGKPNYYTLRLASR